jgi:hypothetical protein
MMSGRTTKVRFFAQVAVGAPLASIVDIPVAATAAGAATWHLLGSRTGRE